MSTFMKLGRVSEKTQQRTLTISPPLDGWKATPSMQALYAGTMGSPYFGPKVQN
jgi:hypothetical protein